MIFHSPPAVARVLTILRRTYTQFDKDRIPAVAASATFFILLAIFPAFASIVSLYGIFADRATIAHELALISPFLPRGAIIVLDTELRRIIAQGPGQSGLTFVISSVVALWSASGGFRALVDGLNIAYETEERRSFLRLTLIAMLLTAAAIFFCVLALNLAVVIPMLLEKLPFGQEFQQFFPILSWPMSFGFSVILLGAIFAYVPCRERPRWRWITWGSIIAATFWLMGTLTFKLYVQQFGSFDRVYGNLGAIVGFLTWIWLSLVILLFGAELNRELERERQGVGLRAT